MSDRISVGLRISEKIWKEAQKYALDKDLYMGELVEKALTAEMKKK